MLVSSFPPVLLSQPPPPLSSTPSDLHFKDNMWLWSDFTPLERKNIGIYVAGKSFETHFLPQNQTHVELPSPLASFHLFSDFPSFFSDFSGIMLYKLGLEAFNGSMYVSPRSPLLLSLCLSQLQSADRRNVLALLPLSRFTVSLSLPTDSTLLTPSGS